MNQIKLKVKQFVINFLSELRFTSHLSSATHTSTRTLQTIYNEIKPNACISQTNLTHRGFL